MSVIELRRKAFCTIDKHDYLACEFHGHGIQLFPYIFPPVYISLLTFQVSDLTVDFALA